MMSSRNSRSKKELNFIRIWSQCLPNCFFCIWHALWEMSPTENLCWRLNEIHYAMGLLPWQSGIISCAIQAKEQFRLELLLVPLWWLWLKNNKRFLSDISLFTIRNMESIALIIFQILHGRFIMMISVQDSGRGKRTASCKTQTYLLLLYTRKYLKITVTLPNYFLLSFLRVISLWYKSLWNINPFCFLLNAYFSQKGRRIQLSAVSTVANFSWVCKHLILRLRRRAWWLL